MIYGTGVDIVECERFERLLKKHSFLSGVYTEQEQGYISSKGKLKAQSAAGIYCAKEALLKACGLGIGSLRLNDIEVGHESSGRPVFYLSGQAGEQLSGFDFKLSISHSANYAAAVVIALKNAE